MQLIPVLLGDLAKLLQMYFVRPVELAGLMFPE